MKFKHLIIVFSIIIIFIVLITALLPLLTAGPGFAVNFRFFTLPLMIVMILLLVSLSIFFLLNYRLFSLLEREDWPALSYYLEEKIFVKGRYNSRKVRILAGSYLVISDYPSVLKLESKAQIAKPSVIHKNALIFGSARVLSGNHKDAAAFFKSYLDKGKVKNRQWIHWYYGFSLLLGGNFNMAEPEFMSLAVSSPDPLITGLSAYFLHSSLAKYSLKPEECRLVAQNGRSRIVKALVNEYNWKKEADKMGTEIHVSIVRKYIDEAGEWLFTDKTPTPVIIPPPVEKPPRKSPTPPAEPKRKAATPKSTASKQQKSSDSPYVISDMQYKLESSQLKTSK